MRLLRKKDPRSVAERARKNGEWLTAASLYEELGDVLLAIDCYEKAGKLIRCGELALLLDREDREELAASFFSRGGDPLQAATLYRKRGEDLKAARAFLEAGCRLDAAAALVDAGKIGEAAEIYEEEGDLDRAAEIFEELGELPKAGALYAKRGLFLKAAACFEEFEDFERAAEIYEKSGRIQQAAAAFGKVGNYTRAARLFHSRVEDLTRDGAFLPTAQQKELDAAARGAAHFYEKAGELGRALDVLVRGGHHESAAVLAERLEQFERAATLYHECRNDAKAAEMYARAGDDVQAAKLEAEFHLDQGDEDAAAEALVRAGDYVGAADLFERAGNFERAALCYETMKVWPRAAQAALQAGAKEKAAVFFERADEPARAAELFMEVGAFDRAAPLFARVHRFFEAARSAAEANIERDMLQYLQKVPASDPNYLDAVVTLARAFTQRGWSSIALEQLERVLQGQSVHGDNLKLWDPMVEALEEEGQLERAEKILRQMMAVSYDYNDVDRRHRALVEKIQEEKKRESSFEITLVEGPGAEARTFDGSRYKLDELLGRGGMGEVYRAFDRLLSRPIAYKVLSTRLAEDPSARDQLLQEARAAAALNHPNIITVYDLGVENGRAFICMELVEGESYLKILKREKRLPVPEVMHLIVSACQGLDHAHHRGIVHRDLKPSNILLTKEHRVKILDFGLAQPIRNAEEDSSGSYGGTPKYIAPEQALGESTDARTDIYSLGATLFELIAGRAPFIDGDVIQHHIHTTPPRLKALVSDVPDALDELVMNCLVKDPEARFQSAGELPSFAQAAGLL